MSLIRWKPFRELDTLHQQMDRLFNDLMRTDIYGGLTSDNWPLSMRASDVWAPAIEIKETDTDLILRVQVPGIEAKDLDVQVTQDRVSIIGEHKEEERTEKNGTVHSEFRYGKFQRMVALPTQVQNERVQAEFKDGVLTLTLPKAEDTTRKAVKVDLGLQEKARESMTQERKKEEHLQEAMRSRTEAEVGVKTSANGAS